MILPCECRSPAECLQYAGGEQGLSADEIELAALRREVAELRRARVEQPAPKPGGVAVWESLLASGLVPAELVADCEARDALGRERYGRPLETHNGRSFAVDAYDELLDAAVYTYGQALEGDGNPLLPEVTRQLLHCAQWMKHRAVTP